MPTPAQEAPMTFTRRDLLRIGTFGAAALARPTASWAQGKKPWETWEYATPPVRGGYFRRSATLDVGLLNPNHWPVNDWLVINMFYEKLLITDGSFRPVPWLAESWTFPDPLTCLMKLRKGVRFSDGEPLNAASGRALPTSSSPSACWAGPASPGSCAGRFSSCGSCPTSRPRVRPEWVSSA
jgi:hypothetical protein